MTGARGHDRRRLRHDRDGGFSLSELLVVIVLLGVIGGIVGTVVRIGLTHQSQMQVRNSAFADARKVIQRVDRDIRSAYLVSGSSPTSIELAMYLNGASAAPTYVTYAVNSAGTTLTRYPCQSASSCTGQVMISNLVQTSTNPVFSFKATYTYSSAQPTADVNVVDANSCAYAANPSQIKAGCVGEITVHLMVQPHTINRPIDVGDGGTELRNSS